ncbi:RHS repeat-associated core domain-containing protein [Rothia sp. LK2588]|uniref:RHS repeat-associated core domain-containing protein n=1 Tax=Rothia sp. LK2588 TaxID=3114369 RepID=UPI0034CE6771
MTLSEKKYCYVPGVDPRSCMTSTYKEVDPYGAREEKTTVVPRDVFDPLRYRFGLVDRGGTGRFLFGVRFYDPGQGVWTQQDSLDAPLDPVNGNRYAYAGGDPVNGFDPTGKFWEEIAGAAVGSFTGAFIAVPAALLLPGAGAVVGGITGGCIGGVVGSLVTNELKNEDPDLEVAGTRCVIAGAGGVGVGGLAVSKWAPLFQP